MWLIQMSIVLIISFLKVRRALSRARRVIFCSDDLSSAAAFFKIYLWGPIDLFFGAPAAEDAERCLSNFVDG